MSGPVVIEARLNELSGRDGNPHVPWTPDEIVADALSCAQAGASVIHFHGRTADGAPDQRAEIAAEVIARVRERCDILFHPTLGYVAGDPDPETRFAPIRQLAADPATRPDLVPLDMGTTNVDAWDAVGRRYITGDLVYRNTTGDLERLARATRALGLKPCLVSWTIGFSRQIERFIEAGLVDDDPAIISFTMTEGRISAAHPGTLAGLEAHLAFLPRARRVAWTACVVGASLLPLADKILARGGHLSAGLGDHHYRELGRPTNADVVARLAARARAAGRSTATTDEARAILGIGRRTPG